MRNAFVDLGSFRGDIIRKYIASPLYSPSDIIHAFEPNPLIQKIIFDCYPPGVEIHHCAVGPTVGTVDLFLNKDKRPNVQGTSICRGKITGDLDFDHPVTVPCVDFPAFIRDLYYWIGGGKIRVKMNIEGAEYPLLNKMCDDLSIRFIDTLYLRTHHVKIGLSEEEHTALLNRLDQVSSLTLKPKYDFV